MSELQSTELKDLASALAKARYEMKVPSKSECHKQFGYAYSNCDDIMEASRDALCKNGLSIVPYQLDDGNYRYLCYKLLHSSGQYMQGKVIVGSLDMPLNEYRKALGWKITEIYKLLTGITGVFGSKEDDNQEEKPQYKSNSSEPISEAQVKLMQVEISKVGDACAQVFHKLGIKKISEIKRSEFNSVLEAVRNCKSSGH